MALLTLTDSNPTVTEWLQIGVEGTCFDFSFLMPERVGGNAALDVVQVNAGALGPFGKVVKCSHQFTLPLAAMAKNGGGMQVEHTELPAAKLWVMLPNPDHLLDGIEH
mgnify:CR=1 FL=1